MAADGSWDSIASLGLLSTTALLDLFAEEADRRNQIERARRPESVTLTHPTYGTAVIRDNKPLLESRLRSCLQDDLAPGDWYALLNRRVFFWPTQERLERLVGAAAYRYSPKLVLIINTERLVKLYGEEITLSSINSGATSPFAWPRGLATFQSIDSFDFDPRRHRGAQAIAELAVNYSVPRITEVTETVIRRYPDGTVEEVWSAPEP